MCTDALLYIYNINFYQFIFTCISDLLQRCIVQIGSAVFVDEIDEDIS